MRALCSETLEVIFRSDPALLAHLAGPSTIAASSAAGRDGSENSSGSAPKNSLIESEENGKTLAEALALVLKNRLEKDSNNEVLEATCKLLETLFCLRDDAFINSFI